MIIMPRVVKIKTPLTSAPEVKERKLVASTPEVKERKASPIVIILSALLLIALSVAGYFYYQYRQSPKIQSAKEIKNLKEEIGTMFELPTNEEPTLATVTDREKLAEQPFFQKAENGDKVLIYSTSGRAVLYRPSIKKIIDVTSVNVSKPETEVAPTETPAPAPAQEVVESVPTIVRTSIYNGSKKVGVTNVVESKLKAVMSNVAVITKENAVKNDYPKTLVVDVTGSNSTSVRSIASALGGEVSSLPAGEKTPADTDVLIIVGEAVTIVENEPAVENE